MNEPKYQIGDRVFVAGLPVKIINRYYNSNSVYLVQFEYLPAMVTIVTEQDLSKLPQLPTA